jgi:predicted ester cyclase
VSKTEETKAMVRRVVDEVINEGDMGVLDELCAPGLAEEMKRMIASFRSAFPDWREEIVELIAEGDTVVGRFKCLGTQQGKFQGLPPTGKRMEVDEVYFLRVEDGRFVDLWGLEDDLNRMRQLGLVPSPQQS